ncbi:MAG: DUF3520 domain-containing protein [Candidatus Synoicihabitans palmerolidicus]|nr:DUF3520 domain-containing protein [Candidatus Synoicihabitans palmerolidicus]
MLTVRVGAKLPNAEEIRQWAFPLVDDGRAFAAASDDFKFAAAVAGFGLVLSDSPHHGATDLRDVMAWAQAGLGIDEPRHRRDFVSLVQRVDALQAL